LQIKSARTSFPSVVGGPSSGTCHEVASNASCKRARGAKLDQIPARSRKELRRNLAAMTFFVAF
jgi:hypothetical protein